ncbi:MAG: mechanosensitive ion channel family protein [Polyangia bacterium]|jgi:small-conductance mechanosensitive channel
MNRWQRLLDLTKAGPFTGPGMSLLTALGTLVVLIFLRRRLPRENRDHGSVLQIFLVIGASLALLRLGLLAVGGGHLAFGRVMAVLSTFFVAMGAVGTLVMAMFEILPARANVHFPLLLRDLILVLAFVVVLFGVLGQSGVDVTSMVTTSAVLTAILGLALQSTLTNLLAGILLNMDRSLGVGDWVQFGNRKGRIAEIHWRSTVLRTIDGDTIIIPNGQITAQEVYNYSRPSPNHRVWLNVGLHYRHPPNQVRKLLAEAARETPGVLTVPEPDCLPVEFGDSAIIYALRYWIDRFDQAPEIEGEVRTRVWYAAARAGLEMPFPIRTVVMQGAQAADADQPAPRELAARMTALDQVDLFATLEPAERELLARGLCRRPFAAGESIIRQGTPGDSMFIIAGGEVHVSLTQAGMNRVIATLGPGDFVGEMSLMTGEPRAATCLAATDVMSFELDHATFQRLLTTRPAVADHMSSLLATRQSYIEKKGGEMSALAAAQTAERKSQFLQRIRSFFELK